MPTRHLKIHTDTWPPLPSATSAMWETTCPTTGEGWHASAPMSIRTTSSRYVPSSACCWHALTCQDWVCWGCPGGYRTTTRRDGRQR